MVFVQFKGNEMKLTEIRNSINEISAIGGLKQVVKGNTDRVEGIKLSKEMAQAMIDWFNSSPYGRKYPKAAKARLHISLGIMSVMGLDRYAKFKGAKEELKHIKDLSKAMRDNVNEAKGKFKKDDLVYNKRTKTVGIVRLGDDASGEVKTDADGNVNVDELEKYNPIKNKHQSNAKVAPSTEKEVNKRGLFNPFKNESVVNEDDNPCWKNYQMVGMKKKNGKDVPNCVPEGLKEGVMSDIHLTIKSSSSEEDFIKKFFKKYGKQVKPNKESILWVKDLYSDVKNESVVNEVKKGEAELFKGKTGWMLNINNGKSTFTYDLGGRDRKFRGKGDKLKTTEKQAKEFAKKLLKHPDFKGQIKLRESVVNEVKYDIGMARKGNGITIYNKAEEEKGDYKNVAHIDSKGKVKYYDKKVPSNIKKQIEAEAKKMMEIKIEGTMKLTDLLNEDVYVKNKKTGNTYQVKNANPAKHVPPSKDDIAKAKSDAEDEPNRQPSKEEPKSEPKKDGPKIELSKDFDSLYYADDIESDVEKLEGKISDEDYKKIMSQVEDLSMVQQDAEEAENYDSPEEAEEDGLDVRPKEEIEKMASDIKDMIRQSNGTPKEEPKSEPKKDEPKSEPKRVPLDKNDSYYIKTAVEKKMGPAAFKALSYGDQQKAYNGEMESRGWEKGDDGEWTKPVEESSKRKIKESKGNTMKLKDLLKESFEGMKVQSNPFHTPFVKENDEESREESNEMNNEQKQAFLEAVKSYKTFGESIYRKEGLSKVYESIRNLVESAGKNMVKETEGSFDGITVGRHVKRMNESFKVFEKTLREVGTLQQRLEASYDEIGETLGKYYEINELEEGNEFGANRAKAIANGDSEFEVDGKTYPVKSVDKKDKDNAKEFTKESKGNMKLKNLLNESFGFGELPSSKLMKMKVSAKDMLASVSNKKVNESEEVEEEKINEGGFATWEMSFADMTLSGVKLSKKNVYKVKARNTVEAIKKAAKMAGVGDSWIATQTHSLKKIG